MRLDWNNRTACIIASGPSLTHEQVDCAEQSGAAIIVINNNWQICLGADVLYACDARWWQFYGGVPMFRGVKYSLEYSGYPDVFQLHNSGSDGIDLDWPNIKTGCNGGYQAINLAVHFGCRRIILIGYDMQHTGGKSHWHGDHPQGLNNAQRVESWIPFYDDLAVELKKIGVEVINCTIETALKCFPRADLREAL